MQSDCPIDKPKPDQRDLYIYNLLELVCISLIILTGPVIATHPVLIFIEISSIWLVLWVVWTHRVSKFYISTDLPSRTRFVAKGPYYLVRYPMYTALLLITLVLILDHFETYRLALWFILLVVFLMDIRFEEKVFSSYFSDYSLYRDSTYRLVPYVY